VTRLPGATVADTVARTQARWLVATDRPEGWTHRLPDWPADALAFGHWRVLHR
jgi:hypothetical protein